ncbi:MAG: membrane protein insertion efficiency factor YidD [Bacteroidota bacterium]|nr:membrane protein insertion efficiency factor YidD [Bacteroidota bacterium]
MNINSRYKAILVILFIAVSLWGQNDAKLIQDHYFKSAHYEKKFANRKITTKLEKKDDKTPFVANLFMEAVYVYKDYISPQDMDVCTFHPSCSEYAFLCLKHQSFPEAVLNTGDRLMRCYGSNYIYYPKDPITLLSENYPDTTK